MNTAWAALPNARHIDWVVASARADPKKWIAADRDVARDAVWAAVRTAARYAVWDAARTAARYAARDAAWSAARTAARYAVWDAGRYAVWDAARDAAWAACAALIAWDDCAHLLGMPTDAVRLLVGSGHHPAVLMLPAVIVKNGEAS